MYLLQAAPKSNKKMGRLAYGYQPLLPFLDRRPSEQPQAIVVKLAGFGYGYQDRLGLDTAQSWRRLGRMGLQPVRLPNLGRLGADRPACIYYGADGVTPESYDYNSDVIECTANGGRWTGAPVSNTPSLPAGAQNPSPVAGGASNANITTVPAGRPSDNPLDYTSPQAAIAAGLDPQTTYNAWSAALSRFPSPQAAISAGVPAGVVNQLWQSAHVAAATKPAQPASIFSSLSPGVLLAAGGGVLLLAAMGGRRR